MVTIKNMFNVLNIANEKYGNIYNQFLNSKDFIKNIGYIFSGFGIAMLINGFFNIYAGKTLGPESYGKYILIDSIMGFMTPFFLMGVNSAVVNINAKNTNKEKRQITISTALILSLIFITASCLLFLKTSAALSNIFSAPIQIIRYAILVSIFFSLFNIGTSIMESNFLMKQRGSIQVIYAITVLITFLISVKYFKSYKSMLFAVISGYILAILISTYVSRKYIKMLFDKSVSKELLVYGIYSWSAGISSTVLTYIDKIMINHFFDVDYVGLYQAYTLSYLFIPGFITTVTITALFPIFSKINDKRDLLKKVDLVIKYMPFLTIIIIICGFFVFKLYGTEYEFDPIITLLFTADGIFLVLSGIYSRLTTSVGVSGARFLSKVVLLKALLNIVLNCLLIPVINIKGAIGATLLCDIMSVIVYRYIYLRQNLSDCIQDEA